MTRWLRPLAAINLGLLATQFLLGMTTNFYAQIPHTLPQAHANFDTRLGAAANWGLLHGPIELQIHVAIGLLIGACALILAALAIRSGDRTWRVLAVAGWLSTVVAGVGGAAFLAYRQADRYSLLMSIGFLGALCAYAAAVYVTKTAAHPRSPATSRDGATLGPARCERPRA